MGLSRRLIAALAAVLLLRITGVAAGELSGPDAPEPASHQQTSVAPAGQLQHSRVFIDPATGRPVQRRPQARAPEPGPRERAMLNRSAVGLASRTLANGAVGIHLQGGFRNLIRVELQPETGQVTSLCTVDDESSLPLSAIEAGAP